MKFFPRIGDEPKVVTVSPVSPVYYRFDATADVDSVLVSVDDVSEDDVCLIFSIQQPYVRIY